MTDTPNKPLSERFKKVIDRYHAYKLRGKAAVACQDVGIFSIENFGAFFAALRLSESHPSATEIVTVRRSQLLAVLQCRHVAEGMSDDQALEAAKLGVISMSIAHPSAIREAVEGAKREERESCAKLLERLVPDRHSYVNGYDAAVAIRARGE